jgi:hypothetical protein
MTAGGKWGRWHWLVLIGLVYGMAFLMPAVVLHGEITAVRAGGEAVDVTPSRLTPLALDGHECFVWGARLAVLPWFANPVLWAGCWLLAGQRGVLASLAGLAAVSLGLTEVVPDLLSLDRDGHRTELLVGYWAWLGSMELLVIAGLSGRLLTRKPEQVQAEQEPTAARLPDLRPA